MIMSRCSPKTQGTKFVKELGLDDWAALIVCLSCSILGILILDDPNESLISGAKLVFELIDPKPDQKSDTEIFHVWSSFTSAVKTGRFDK